MSRLNFAPKLSEIEITDIKNGIGVFKPKPDKAVSFAALKETLKKAGYKLASAQITVKGKLSKESTGNTTGDGTSPGQSTVWLLTAATSGQQFAIESDGVDPPLPDQSSDTAVEISGDWRTVGEEKAAHEVIKLPAAKKASGLNNERRQNLVRTEQVDVSSGEPVVPPLGAPIRTTSPGLTVYRGGAFVPRYIYTRQQLGALKVDRHTLLLSLSYTPTPKLQLEADIPITHVSFKLAGNQAAITGGGAGVGNITVSGKYRFFRRVEVWGDRQAAVRFGFELPTGTKRVPDGLLQIPGFVRQQLSAIGGGFSPHADLTYSQAKGR
ncbi:MAG: hypothetical protein ABI882_22780, partial [Acidobacteriota bacterium]